MKKTTFSKAKSVRLPGLLVIAYVAIFYALPTGFFTSSASSLFKHKPIADVGYEFSEGYDFEVDNEPALGDSGIASSSFQVAEVALSGLNCSLCKTSSNIEQNRYKKLFSLNCSFIFYG